VRRPTTREMSDAHEVLLAQLLGGRRTKGSGNQFNDAMDGRNRRYDQAYAFAWDGKSTLGKSVGVTREMWEKAQRQAGGEMPMLALRWYDNERLAVGLDLIAVEFPDFLEVLEAARRYRQVKDCLELGHETNPTLHPRGYNTECWRCETQVVED
jgi:hypothetical protein